MAYDPNNSGDLGKNKNKEKEEHPELSGKCMVDGKPYWISGWVKTNRETGERFISVGFRPREDKGQKNDKPVKMSALEDPNDPIPF